MKMSDRRAVCPGCSLLCDGLTIGANSPIPVETQSCHVGSAWFANRQIESAHLSAEPDERVQDRRKIKQLFQQSSAPLITGIECLTTQEQQAAVKVADRFFAGIDTHWSSAGRGSMYSFQRYG